MEEAKECRCQDEKNIETCDCGENCNCGEDCNCNENQKCSDSCECKSENKKDKKKKEKHEDKLNEAYNMISSLEDKLLREKAEAINFKRRKEEETNRLLKYSNESLVKELLPIVDNLERALDMEEDDDEEVNKFLAGVKMIYCNLVSTLEKFEVKVIDGANKPFDPTYHQAMMTEKVDGVEAGQVIDVLQKGYLLKDRVIRPAMVKVSE